MAIHKTLQILNTKYPNEPANIFTDYINVLYFLNTQIQQPSARNNHPNESLFESMVQLVTSNNHNPMNA